MSGITNVGALEILKTFSSAYGNVFLALVTNSAPPTAVTETFGELEEIVSGNGYASGGFALASLDSGVGSEQFDQDGGEIVLNDVVWSAVNGSIPGSGGTAAFLVITDANPVLADRKVLAYWPLDGYGTALDSQLLTVTGAKLRIET